MNFLLTNDIWYLIYNGKYKWSWRIDVKQIIAKYINSNLSEIKSIRIIVADIKYAMRLAWCTVLEKIYLEVNVFVDGRWRCAGYPVAVQGHASHLPHSWAPLLAPIYPSLLTEGDTCLWFSRDRSQRLLSVGFWSHRRVPITVTNHFKRFTTRRTMSIWSLLQ